MGMELPAISTWQISSWKYFIKFCSINGWGLHYKGATCPEAHGFGSLQHTDLLQTSGTIPFSCHSTTLGKISVFIDQGHTEIDRCWMVRRRLIWFYGPFGKIWSLYYVLLNSRKACSFWTSPGIKSFFLISGNFFYLMWQIAVSVYHLGFCIVGVRVRWGLLFG